MQANTAVITGASRGIGRAIAVALGSAGWNVVINYFGPADANFPGAVEEAINLVKKAGGNAIAVEGDITSSADHKKLIDAAAETFGGIDLLVNNAGVAPPVRADLLEMDPKSFDFVMNTNIKGPLFLTIAVAKHMIATKRQGLIVNTGSISAYTASVNRGEYCLAKSAVAMMTKLFAVRLAEHGINVYETRPGIIATDMTSSVKDKYDKLIAEGITPIRRWGKPEDIAQAVLAIAERRLPFSTGEVINVDGGFHLKSL